MKGTEVNAAAIFCLVVLGVGMALTLYDARLWVFLSTGGGFGYGYFMKMILNRNGGSE